MGWLSNPQEPLHLLQLLHQGLEDGRQPQAGVGGSGGGWCCEGWWHGRIGAQGAGAAGDGFKASANLEGFRVQQQLMANPDMMRQMMDSPAMQVPARARAYSESVLEVCGCL